MSSDSLQKRNTSLDLVRIVATFFVVCTHSYFQNDFYTTPLNGLYFYILSIFRNLFLSCVPLFLILTGYLMNKKKLSKAYYKSISKTLCIYILACCATAIFRIYLLGEEFTLSKLFLEFTGFKLAPYAWYIEMYFGLFLFIPFLNLSYHALKSKKQKQCLVLTCILLTAFPPVCNMFDISQSQTLSQFFFSGNSDVVLPVFWIKLYPVTYYFVGCYLSEFKISIRKSYLALLLLVHLFMIGTFVYFRNYNSVFLWDGSLEWESIIHLISAVLIFMIISGINTSAWNNHVRKIIKYFSDLCLGTYLVSWIFDVLIYTLVRARISDPLIFRRNIPGLILIIFVCSMAFSSALNFFTFYILNLKKSSVSDRT